MNISPRHREIFEGFNIYIRPEYLEDGKFRIFADGFGNRSDWCFQDVRPRSELFHGLKYIKAMIRHQFK